MDSGMVGPGLLAVGLVVLAVLIISTLVRAALKQHTPAGILSGILALVAITAIAAAVLIHALVLPITPNPLAPAFVAGLLAISMGMAAFLLERRRQLFRADESSGLLVIAAGVFLVIVALFVPALPSQVWPASPPVTVTVSVRLPSPTVLPSTTTAPTHTASPSPTQTLTPSPTPQPTVTPTRERYATRTSTPTAVVEAVCNGVVNFNLNLRATPDLDSQVLVVIPHATILAIGGRSQDAAWWFVEYNDQWGWVSAEYVSAEQRCSAVPVREN